MVFGRASRGSASGFLPCPPVAPENDDRITAFLAWRRRRALEAGLFRPEQLLDEWVFRRILLHAPRDIYDLEKLKLLTGPLQHHSQFQ